MARQPNDIETVNITLSTTQPIKQHLDRLVKTGLYGKNAADAAERLVASRIDQFLKDGTLKG